MTSSRSSKDASGDDLAGDDFDPREYDKMLELDRLESIEEDMTDLGVTTLDEVRRRIADLHEELDANE